MELEGSKTQLNLLTAFAGECEAREKYTLFAAKARQDGFKQIGTIFDETGDNEKEHAEVWWKVLTGGAGQTKDNLKNAIDGENHEWTKMYPQFAQEAKEEGFESIAALFEMVAEIEQAHEQRFQTLLRQIENGEVFSRPHAQTWVCSECGYHHEATDAPQSCPVCGNEQAYFQIAAKAN